MKRIDDYKSGRIRPSEMSELAEHVDSLSDSQLEEYLRTDWDDFESSTPLSKKRIKEMYPSARIKVSAGRSLIVFKAVAAILAIVCLSLSFAIIKDNQTQKHLSETTFTVSAGIDGPSSMTLPDGTSVRLNARSVLSYNSDFGRTDRRITLVGEGFFDVAKDPERTFVVETPNMEISVHGTKFNVYAYPERSVDEMSLVEGSVSVVAGGNEFHITPGEKLFYDKGTGSTHITKTDNNLETAWLGQELSFNHETLANVFDVLERRFGVTIKCDPSFDLNDRYTGSFTDRRINDIMGVLKMHYNFSYTYSDNIINITNN